MIDKIVDKKWLLKVSLSKIYRFFKVFSTVIIVVRQTKYHIRNCLTFH